MNRKDFLLMMDEVMELDMGTLTGEENLRSLEAWDSLSTLSFIAMVDEQFGITLPTDRIADSQTVNDLFSLLEERIS